MIPGDGIGPEVSAAVLRIIEAAGVEIEWERFIVGGHAQDLAGSSLPDEVIESVRRNGIALKGPVATPIGSGFESVNVRLRKILDLYANLRPVRSLPGVQSRFGDVDMARGRLAQRANPKRRARESPCSHSSMRRNSGARK